MREAELFDGTVLEFPDDTPDAVIAKVAKEQTLAKRGNVPAGAGPAPGTGVGPDEASRTAAQRLATGTQDKGGGQNDPRWWESALRGAAQIGSLGFGDEAAAFGGALRGRLEGKSFQEEYDTILKDVRRKDVVHAEANPAAYYGAGLAASLPGAAVRGAATVGARAAQAAKYGAATGTVGGFGAGEGIEDRLTGAATGGVVGGALGAAASPLVDAAGAGVRALGNVGRGIVNPKKQAATVIDRAAGIDPPAFTPEQLEAARAAGTPLITADLGGKAMASLARSAANQSPEARQVLAEAVEARAAAKPDRIRTTLSKIMGDDLDEVAAKAERGELAKAVNDENYTRMRASPEARAVWDRDLARMMEEPNIRQAAKAAEQTSGTAAVLQGGRPVKSPFEFMDDMPGGGSGFRLRQQKDGSYAKPTIDFWDQVQRSLSDDIGKATRAGAKEEAARLIQVNNMLKGKLDDLVPQYKDARQGAAAFFQAENAFDAGRKFATNGMTTKDAYPVLAKMKPGERDLFAKGFASELHTRLGKTSVDVAGIFKSPESQAKIKVALGPKRATQFEAVLHAEKVMHALKGEVTGNSTTARQLAEMGMAGLAGGYVGELYGSGFSTGAVVGAAARKGKQVVNRRVSDHLGRMLRSEDPKQLEKLAQMAARSSAYMDTLRAMSRAATVAAAARGGQLLTDSQ